MATAMANTLDDARSEALAFMRAARARTSTGLALCVFFVICLSNFMRL